MVEAETQAAEAWICRQSVQHCHCALVPGPDKSLSFASPFVAALGREGFGKVNAFALTKEIHYPEESRGLLSFHTSSGSVRSLTTSIQSPLSRFQLSSFV